MEKLKQFESYFTKLCCVHLRDPIPLCRQKEGATVRASGTIRIIEGRATAIDNEGYPVKQAQAVPSLPIEVSKESDNSERMVFTLVVENCVVLPSPSLDRIILGYESGNFMMEVSVSPDDIVSITMVAGEKPQEKRIISS